MTSRIVATVRFLMVSRSSDAVLAILAIVLTSPSLRQGWVADDFLQRRVLLTSTLTASLRDLFVFVSPDPNVRPTDISIDLGTLPWWTLDNVRVSFFRPLSVLTHWLDYRLWPDSAALMHAQSLLWYAGVCVVAARLYRRWIGPGWVASLAAFLFTADAVHVGSVAWLANRNTLMAAFFGLLALVAHDRWRRDDWQAGRVWAPLGLAAALLSAEAGVSAAGYLLAHALFLDRGPWRRRAAALAPCLVVIGVWAAVYQQLGYGAWGSGFYVDPTREPLRFAAAALERGPLLLLSQWVGQAPMLYNLVAASARRVVWAGAALGMLMVGIVLLPLVRGNRAAAGWMAGMVLAVIPACSITLLSGRLLLWTGLGAMGLVAQFTGGLLDRAGWLPSRAGWRIAGWALGVFLLAVHAVLAPILMPVMAGSLDRVQAIIGRVAEIGPLPHGERQHVTIVNAPSPFHLMYLASLRSLRRQPVPAHLRILAPGYFTVAVSRVDAQTLMVRPEGGYLVEPGTATGIDRPDQPLVHLVYVYQLLDRFFRSDAFPMTLGQRIVVTGMTVEVTALSDDGRPAEARARFALPLEHPSLKWLRWDWEQGAYVEFTPPKVGETVQIRGAF